MTLLLASGVCAALAAGSAGCAVRRLRGIRRAVSYAEHELRGPLGAVLLAVDLGLSSDGLGPNQLRAIRSEVGRAERVLGDLSRARHGLAPVMAVTEVDVRRVVRDLVEAWRPAAAAAGVTLDFSGDTRCRAFLGDPVRLAQATANLIANAIEHGGSRVRVTTGNSRAGIRVLVTDDGPGLPRGILAGNQGFSGGRAVQRRGRRPAISGGRSQAAGRGQGLGIVAGIAVAHGGSLCVLGRDPSVGGIAPGSTLRDDDRGPGASLVLELPAAPRS